MSNVPEMGYSQGYDDSKLLSNNTSNMAKDTMPKSKYGPINGIGTLVREGEIQLVRIDRTVFEKTERERVALRNIQSQHKRKLKRAGYNPQKQLNIPGESFFNPTAK